jgi:hypothetical protein
MEMSNTDNVTSIIQEEMATPSPLSQEANHVTQKDIYDQPQKYTGYKKYSWFLASDDDFLIFRRFGTLNARVLLMLQDELTVAEEKLKALDEQYSLKDAPRLHNGSFRVEQGEEKQQEQGKLLLEIKDKVSEYSMCLIQ